MHLFRRPSNRLAAFLFAAVAVLPAASVAYAAPGSPAAQAAGAAPEATKLVEKSREPWQYHFTKSCGGVICDDFPVTLSGKQRLEITAISCVASVPGASGPGYAGLSTSPPGGGVSAQDYIPAVAINAAEFVATHQTDFIVNPKEKLRVLMVGTASIGNLACRVTGEMVKLGKKK